MKKIILFCLCILLCLSTFTGCFSNKLSHYKPDLSTIPWLNSLSNDSFEYLGNTYNPFFEHLPTYNSYINHVLHNHDNEICNLEYFTALIGLIPCMRSTWVRPKLEYPEMIYASPYDPEFNILLAKSSYLMYGETRYIIFVKEGYVPYASIYDVPLAELYRIEVTNPEIIVQSERGEAFNHPFYFRREVGDLSGTNLTINDIISDEFVVLHDSTCENLFVCKFDGHDYLSAFYYQICYDKDGIPYIRMRESETDDTRSEHFYRVKEEYRDIFAWEYFGCEGHIDPNAKYDPDNEGTENPGGEGVANPGGEGTENPDGEGES